MNSSNISNFTFFGLIVLLWGCEHASSMCFKSIISFGDSLADTGNLLHLSPPDALPIAALPPYGQTYFNHPTGRFSDGRLIIDFIAQAYGLPLVRPFYGGKNPSGGDFGGGVNFAVAASTALPDSFFAKHGVQIPHANVSLEAQLSWFRQQFLPTLCLQPANCEKFLATSLVIVGEIGGNDYNHPFLAGKGVELVKTFVAQVVTAIGSTIQELIKLGAVTLMVPGNLPIGCSASYLTNFKTTNIKDYEAKTGCLNWLNKFSQYHNRMLQQELNSIRKQNPNITIIYADYYNAAISLYRSPKKYDCEKFLATSLVIVGEIGGNDYNHPFLAGKGVELVKTFVAQVVTAIGSTIQELIKLGAVTLMVPGNLPIGCSASYLTNFKTTNIKDYEAKTGCLNWLNKFSQYHNKMLQQELNRIRKQNPNITIIYADYYNAAISLYRSPKKYGFSKGALVACCGGGGPYNVNSTLMCGDEGSEVCENPSEYVSWDGLHLTEAAYGLIATGLVGGSYTVPQLHTFCAFNNANFSDN